LNSRALEWVKQPTKNGLSKTNLLTLIYPSGPPSPNRRLHFIVTNVKKDTPANDLNQILSLNCLILGDDPDRIFTVEIAKSKNISILKDLIKIKQAPHLDHIPASHLDLWKVDFSPDNLETELANFDDSHPKLSPIKKLSMFEDDVEDDHLHVIAKVSAHDQILSLNCLVLGDDPDRLFTVEIAKTKNVSILKDQIKEKKGSQLKDVDASDLDLWRVDSTIIDGDDPSAYGSKMNPGKLLLDVFQSGLDIYRVHVVVGVPVAKGKEVSASGKRASVTVHQNECQPGSEVKSSNPE